MARREVRWETGTFVAEGLNGLREALEAGFPPRQVFVAADAPSRVEELIGRAARSGSEILRVEGEALRRVLDTVHPQSVAAVVPFVHVTVGALAGRGEHGPVLVAAGVADPGNAGTIVRSAAAAGARGVVFCTGSVDPYNPKVVRATAGSIFRVPLAAGISGNEALGELGRAGFRRVAAQAHGGVAHTSCHLAGEVALVVGSESHGLDGSLAGELDEAVTVPLAAGSESLNVAMAATLLLFEAARQAGSGGTGAAGRIGTDLEGRMSKGGRG